jgi:3-oxoacyl-[acyl-carrier-protein] synthase-3
LKKPIIEFAGTGRYTPEKVLTNDDLSKLVDTNDEWITERTGIKERRISSDAETLAYMGKQAAGQALAEAGLAPEDLDTILFATASPDRLLPSTACDLQALLGAENAAAMDIGAACSGFIYGVTVAEGLVASGKSKNILVVGGERLSRIIDYRDRATCILFGDGVGAAIIRPASGDRGVTSTYLKSDGRLAELLWRPSGGSSIPATPETIEDGSVFMQMAGPEVFKHAVKSMTDACDKAMAMAGVTGEDIDVMIPHQANIRIIKATAKHAGLPMDKVVVNVDRYGNTSAASIPLALDEQVRAGKIKTGDTVLLVAFGAGFTWGSMVVKW